jgi:transposase
MKYIKKVNREQITMLPDTLDDYVSEDNPVRVIDVFVDSLNMDTLGFCRAQNDTTGRPSYDPKDLLKLYIYGYFNKIRSSRKLMKECTRNVELFFLLGKLVPDFRTIADFRKNNAKAIRNVFRSFAKLCLKMGLYKRELLAVDGTKVRAQNSHDNCYTAEVLEKKIANIEEKLQKFFEELDENDSEDNKASDTTPEAVKKAIEELKNRKEKYDEYLKQLEKIGEKQLLTTDPEAHRMHTKDGFHSCFNIQTAVDSESHLIAGYEVTSQGNDIGLLCKTVEEAKDILEVDTIKATADKGYDSRADILNCIMNGTDPHVIPKYDKEETVFTLDYKDAEITEEIKASTKPEDIRKCLHAGVLPGCYEKSNISVETLTTGDISCFIRNSDGAVICPTGNAMYCVRCRGENKIYANKDACRQCKSRCKASSAYKTVSFGPYTTYVPVKMYGKSKCQLNEIPQTGKNPYNHTFDRDDYIKPKQVIVHVRHDERITKLRKTLVEHPFGTVKWSYGFHYVLCRGKEKAAAELGLSFLAYNLTRAINMVGVKKLIEAI